MQLPVATTVLLLWATAYAAPLCNCPVGNCTVALSSGTCHATLADAVHRAKDGDIVYVTGEVPVPREITVERSVSLVGCGSGAKVYSTLNAPQGGMFRAIASTRQRLQFTGIVFERRSGTYSSFLRTPELGDGEFPEDPMYSIVDISISSCIFNNFQTMARGGSTVFVGRAGKITIADSVFTGGNTVRHSEGKERWESGGGAVWLREALEKVTIENSLFNNNRHLFQHGNGGALMIDRVDPKAIVTFGSGVRFVDNMAPGGGAVYIGHLDGQFKTEAEFTNNQNIEGWGTRGGAMWIQNMQGANVEIGGVFMGNKANIDSASSDNGKGRGGAIATNQIIGSTVTIKARFVNNQSLGGAAVLDGQSGGQALGGGSTMVFSGCLFYGNRGIDGKDMAVRILKASTGAITLPQTAISGTVTLR